MKITKKEFKNYQKAYNDLRKIDEANKKEINNIITKTSKMMDDIIEKIMRKCNLILRNNANKELMEHVICLFMSIVTMTSIIYLMANNNISIYLPKTTIILEMFLLGACITCSIRCIIYMIFFANQKVNFNKMKKGDKIEKVNKKL